MVSSPNTLVPIPNNTKYRRYGLVCHCFFWWGHGLGGGKELEHWHSWSGRFLADFSRFGVCKREPKGKKKGYYLETALKIYKKMDCFWLELNKSNNTGPWKLQHNRQWASHNRPDTIVSPIAQHNNNRPNNRHNIAPKINLNCIGFGWDWLKKQHWSIKARPTANWPNINPK